MQCPANVFHSSATGTGEKSRCTTDTDLWPQRGDPLIEPIPPPLDDISWEQQRSMHWDKRKEREIAKKDALLLPKFWVFLDRYVYLLPILSVSCCLLHILSVSCCSVSVS